MFKHIIIAWNKGEESNARYWYLVNKDIEKLLPTLNSDYVRKLGVIRSLIFLLQVGFATMIDLLSS